VTWKANFEGRVLGARASVAGGRSFERGKIAGRLATGRIDATRKSSPSSPFTDAIEDRMIDHQQGSTFRFQLSTFKFSTKTSAATENTRRSFSQISRRTAAAAARRRGGFRRDPRGDDGGHAGDLQG
jgi:hypothetical protein